MKELSSQDKTRILSSIRDINDFPKEGIVFKDITTLLNDKEAFNLLMNHLQNRYKDYDLDYVAGIDSRGFIFGAALADRLKIGFVPVRKKGKLPSTTVCEKYELEYGFDEVEIHLDAFHEKEGARVLLIDDLIATGGTANASAKLIKKIKANLVEACFLLNLSFLDGKKRVEEHTKVYTIFDV
ncbi:adenine phosphoribosyltransferase [Arcobacter sp. CECT 8985]|uniref:adenine phosphoribosyltransferase n=1 Tax=Arcobacter sp. CECT 8985 TaxID=1935424 RepID=UPI00100B78E0|nr:adenine phosphoribosyltransferase [Arcobacter sp. CECT 8985]RXJ85275.1 adenine phosphoribosyltransferase [Arcobacter sp. CECT 8985]